MTYHVLFFSSRQHVSERSSGCHRIATYMRDQGIDVEVIDFAAHWNFDHLKQLVIQRTTRNTLFFGFSTFFSYWTNTLSLFTEWLKNTYPDIPVVLGGNSVASADAKNIDYWVDGYGEIAIIELAKSLTGNSTQELLIEDNGSKKIIKSLKSYFAGDLKSYKNILEKRDFVEEHEWLTIEFSRGCKFACSYCNFPILGVKEDTSRTKEDFEYEMKYNYDNFGITNYYVADETFNDRKEKIIKFADVVDTLNFKPFFSGFLRADLLISQPQSWEHLSRLNFGGQFYGIESFNHQSAKTVGKGMHPDKIKQGLIDIRSYMSKNNFYRGTVSLIAGLPYDSNENWVETDLWLQENWKDQGLMVFSLQIYNSSKFSNNELTNVSDFSKNPEKYNIREIKNAKDTNDEEYKYRNFFKEGTELLWEHDSMNIFDAKRITKEMTLKSLVQYPLNNFTLGIPEFAERKKVNSLRELSNMKLTDISKKPNSFLDDYINKKLNL